jgi:hypothetical protein
VPGERLGGQRRGSVAAADPDLLARGRGSAHHLGADDYAWASQEPTEPRRLPSAGDRSEQAHYAMAPSPRRGDRPARARGGEDRRTLSRSGGPGGRPRHDTRRRRAHSRHAVRIPVRGPAARFAH